MSYFSTHNHSHFSNFRLLDSTNRPEHLFNRAAELGLTGFTITDHATLSGHVQIMRHYEKLKKEGKLPEGFTVGYGSEEYLVDEIDLGIKYFHWLVIAKDRKGHDILRKLSSQAWDNAYTDRGMQRVPITKQQVKDIMERENGKGHLIVTSACLGGELGSHALAIKGLEETGLVTEDPLLNHIVDKYMGEWQSFKDIDINELINYHKQEMVEYVNWNIEVFGKENFFIELAPNSNEQVYANEMLYNLAKAYDLKPIFATDSHYLTKDDQAIHRAFLNSKDGEREVDDFYSTAYMMDIDEVWEYMQISFTREQFIEMRNNLEYMRSMIEEYSLFREQEIPRVEVQVPEIMHPQITDGEKYPHMYTLLGSDHDQDLFWIRTCLNELYKRDKWNEKYLETLENEAEVIVKVSERLGQDMSAYYNTAKRLIEIMWDKGNSLVGASRGSAMAFLSNWLLDITQIDPIPYEIPYWRHLSANRPELPKLQLGFQIEPFQGVCA